MMARTTNRLGCSTILRGAFCSLLTWLAAVPVALAEDAASSRAAAFRAVSGKPEETVSGGALLVSAYAVIWVLLLAYIYRLHRMSRATHQRVEALEKRLHALPQLGAPETPSPASDAEA